MSKSLIKKYAKFSERPSREIAEIWERAETELLGGGMLKGSPQFYQSVIAKVRVEIGMEEKPALLDKFKKMLG